MRALLVILLVISSIANTFAQSSFNVKGQIIDATTRKGVPYALISIVGMNTKAAVTDAQGNYVIKNVEPGIYNFESSSVGYVTDVSPQYQISPATGVIEIELKREKYELDNIVVKPSPFPQVTASPVSLRRIGIQEIEKSPGANRDVSRIVQSYPGVAFSPAGYRNDLIVRGGAPSENRFFLDGVEIPNINHFSTQGASGGPVSIINADLIRQIDFYTGAFPTSKRDAMSSMLDIRLKDGNPDAQNFKFTVGASEVGASASGHIGDKTTYIASVRQSYLQLLFRALGLPFLPNFIDGQFKVKHKFSPKSELTVLGVAGFDTMTLNDEAESETSQYILNYLPAISQETFTIGGVYKYYGEGNVTSVVLSHSYLNNKNIKYYGNDDSDPQNLITDINSRDQKTTFKVDNRIYGDKLTFDYGIEGSYSPFTIDSYQKVFSGASSQEQLYNSSLGLLGWGVFGSMEYESPNNRVTGSLGIRMDGNDFSGKTSQFWRQFSPRGSISYRLNNGFSLNGSAGIYYQMPAYTSLSYSSEDGERINGDLGFMNVKSIAAGIDWRYEDNLLLSAELFYKHYGNALLSIADNIPLASKGNDYGIVGNEALSQSAQGRSYGVELMGRWQIAQKLSLVSSVTLFRSEYRNNKDSELLPSAWDNRFIVNTSGTYVLGKGWSVGAKLSAIGGSPYTPYDVDKSSFVQAWDVYQRPYYDYSLYNTGRLDAYAQLDMRVDKSFYFDGWMLGLYIDIQNISTSEFTQPDILISTGEIENPTAAPADQRYKMKYIENVSGTVLPTIGIMVEF